MSRKNILIVTDSFPPEPIVIAGLMKDLAEKLSQEHDVTVITPRATRPMGFEMNDFRTHQYPYKIVETDSFTYPPSKIVGRFRESYSMGSHVGRYIDRNHENIDVIYNGCWPLAGQYIVARKAKKYNIPTITMVQDIYPESLAAHLPKGIIANTIISSLLPLDKYIIKNSKFTHTISEKMVKHLSETRKVPKERFIAIRNWQDEEEFIKFHESNQDSGNKSTSEPLTFMYMGNVGPLAGLELVIDSFYEAALPDARLVIAGSGSQKKVLQDYVALHKIPNIEFWDVPQGKVPEVQSKADIMVLPIKKGFGKTSIPSKLPAYMFSKKPILASVDAESDTGECILTAECGWVVEPENKELFKQAIEVCAKLDKKELIEKGLKGFDFAMKNLSRANNLKMLSEIFNTLLKA